MTVVDCWRSASRCTRPTGWVRIETRSMTSHEPSSSRRCTRPTGWVRIETTEEIQVTAYGIVALGPRAG